MIQVLIFDWGDTIMRDFPDKEGPMAYWDMVELIPGAKEALLKLRMEYACCIATSAGASDTGLMIKALERVGVDKYFRCFFSAKDLGYNKPDKRFFNAILQKINQNAQSCIMIGNSYEKDIKGAKSAGMNTVLLNENKIEVDFKEADYVINHMNELYDVVKELDNK